MSPGVLGVGSASLFSDTGHELVTSLLPTFLSSTLHSGPGALGAIDGVSDALTGLCKLAGGPLANDPRRRARLASSGYLGTAVATAAIGLATAVWQVAVLRALAWVSRGIRSPARDMLLTSLASRDAYGRAFGVERAGDNAGAIIGPLLASVLVAWLGVRHAILLAIVPGALAAVAITIAAREARRTVTDPGARRTLSLNLRELRQAGLARVLTPVAFFELGNVATTLLILRATDLLHTGGGSTGRDLTAATSLAILLYAAHNAAATVAALVGGQLADRLDPRIVFASGAAVYVAGYVLFAVGPHPWPPLLAAFLLSGIGIGFAETAESTVVARGLPDRLRSNGFGVLGLTQALGDLGSTVVAGLLWSLVSPTLAFGYVAAWMAASVVTASMLRSSAQETPE
ncbi:MAG: MFS transporter [Nocardioidaceae bacterium]